MSKNCIAKRGIEPAARRVLLFCNRAVFIHCATDFGLARRFFKNGKPCMSIFRFETTHSSEIQIGALNRKSRTSLSKRALCRFEGSHFATFVQRHHLLAQKNATINRFVCFDFFYYTDKKNSTRVTHV